MRSMEPAPLAELPRFPAVGGTCLIALGIYALATPAMLDPGFLDARAFWAEPWRLLTSVLIHGGQLNSPAWIGGLIHVGFNCYWLWLLGAGIEQRLGHLRTLGLMILFGVAGGALEYGFNGSSVGLSGVVYGFAAMLWVLGRRRAGQDLDQHRKWANLIDSRTIKFFVAWFWFCVVATWLDAMAIANFAHAGGAALGLLIGWAMVERRSKRALAIALTIAALVLCLASATVFRPWINLRVGAVRVGPSSISDS